MTNWFCREHQEARCGTDQHICQVAKPTWMWPGSIWRHREIKYSASLTACRIEKDYVEQNARRITVVA